MGVRRLRVELDSWDLGFEIPNLRYTRVVNDESGQESRDISWSTSIMQTLST